MFRLALFTLPAFVVIGSASLLSAAESAWVQRGFTGRLIYVPDAQGDRIPDFSGVGYQGGAQPIPTVAGVLSVAPIPGDDTVNLQAAIDQVSSLPLGPDGFRGAVELAPGDYQIGGQLAINTSGVVLRGAGRNAGGTKLIATGTDRRELIQIAGSGSQSLTGSTRNMIDKVVPVGATSFRVDSTAGFAVGDTVRVTRPSTANWISDLGMDNLPPRSDGRPITQWQAGSFNIRYDRVITRIEGDRLFVDEPLTNAFEQRYGGGQIKRYTWDTRIENVGVENLLAESEFAFDQDEDHSWNFVSIDDAQHIWVRDATSAHFARSAVLSNPGAKWVTVDNVVNLSPKSRVTGGRRYTFDLSGQLELVTNSEANEGRHDFVNNSTRPAGPHVFHNSVAKNALDESGPHQRWATGTLFDNITVEGDQINARNRGNFGTGHGWAGANMVIWNSAAESFIVQNPPTAQNWLVGSTGAIIDDQTFGPQPPGYVDSHGTPVEVASLYEAQVADAADVVEFRWSGGEGSWTDPAAWQERLTPGAYRVETRDYLIGDIDNFTQDGAGSVDEAYIDPAWASLIQGSSAQPITGFDDTSTDRNVAFSVAHQLDPRERVVHASLALAMTSTGGGTESDALQLFDAAAEHRRLFSELGWDEGLAAGGPFVGVVDLGHHLDDLQQGLVNVQLAADAGVDWAMYVATVASPLASARGANVVLDTGGRALVDSSIDGIHELTLGATQAAELAIVATGLLQVDSVYSQGGSGVLEIELLDDDVFGVLEIMGDASLDGVLQIALGDDYAPLVGEEFSIIQAEGEVTGEFTTVMTPLLESGLAWDVRYSEEAVSLSVVYSGDNNADSAVNAADYAILRDMGRPIAAYDAWAARFGSVSLLDAVSIPEPAGGLILLSSFLTYSLRPLRSGTT